MSLAKGGDTAIAHATVFMYITAQDQSKYKKV